MTKQKNKKWLMAGVLGTLAGAVGGLLLAPQSGKKTRQQIANLNADLSLKTKDKVSETEKVVKDVFGKYSNEGKTKYVEIKKAVVSKVAAVKTASGKIDKNKYGQLVDEVLVSFKKDLKSNKNTIGKLSEYLKKDWDKIKESLS